MSAGKKYVIGVDVGTASVRAGIVCTSDGSVVSNSKKSIQINRGVEGHVEQCSENIWSRVREVVSDAVGIACREAGMTHDDIVGIGFDATCSMVVTHADPRETISVNADNDNRWDVIMWMDHRATKQTQAINATNHPVLQYVGGAVSPEMAIPKLTWLRENKPAEWWSSVGLIFELPDWLVYKATGKDIRSMCSTVCKWNYVNDASQSGWDSSYLQQIGFDDSIIPKIGTEVAQIGERCGFLSDVVKREFGLTSSTVPISVSSSLIDAHAGGLALCTSGQKQVAVIAGTSTCFMALHPEKNMIPGIWGPYKDAMVPGMWLHEGGMSATGALLDHIIQSHPACQAATAAAADCGTPLYSYLEKLVGASPSEILQEVVSRELHVYPDFLGNRSPLGDSSLKGMLTGLTLDATVGDLAALFCAVMISLAYGVKHVADVLQCGGYDHLESFVLCGGMSQSDLFCTSLASVSGKRVEVVPGGDAMLLGCAVSAATASGIFGDLQAAQAALSPRRTAVAPLPEELCAVHKKRFGVYTEMLRDQQKYRRMMAE
eukprot:TRINITY_DN38475_c0_g1_i1.p1 TRINITY_DN38475_c0_g1~~TRINITY_DN38475_c0_g1_i1.p1  ORF type:complete len:583 (+),score=177.43 TRINITY_DN38475_c0_g1_i1:112-1749(+)